MTTSKVEYPNLLSRLLIGPMFERQFIVPAPAPKWLERFLRFYERRLLRIDLTAISLDRPVFLIGLPRSGTSMLQDIICTHPDLAYITNAMHQFRSCFCAAEVLRKRFNLDGRGERHLGDSVEVTAGSPNDAVCFWSDWLKWDPVSLNQQQRSISDFSEAEIEEMRTGMRKIMWCFGKENARFFSKNPGLIPDLLLLDKLFPDASFVHIVRDPRQCANSMVKLYHLEQVQLEKIKASCTHGTYEDEAFVPYPRMPLLAHYMELYGPEDIRTTAHIWNDAVHFVNDCRSVLPGLHEVRYEDILREPRDEIQKIMEFCELDIAKMDNKHFREKLSQVGVLRHTNRYGDFDIVEQVCDELMHQYDYL